jgi:transposase
MLLTKEEKNRIEIIQAVIGGKLDVEDAATLLSLSVRQIYRLIARADEGGITSILHANKGRVASNKIADQLWERILLLVKHRYQGINDRHLQEILKREHSIEVGRESLRKRLRLEGFAPKRKRRKKKYRARRERKAAFGCMLQIDASPHDWLEGRAQRLTLVGARDDATGYVWCGFEESETTWAYIALMREILLSHGLPFSLYSDRHTIFHSPREATIIEQLKNEKPLTQFGRAMNELGIKIINAYSPQAKGRIERLWEFFQDRLVVEMRLKGIKTEQEANQYLPGFLKQINARHTVPAHQSDTVFRVSPRARELDRILCLKETRVVNSDHTLSYEGLIIQLPRSTKYASIAKQRVEVLQLKDGSVEVVYKKQVIQHFTQKAMERMLKEKQ